MANTGGDGVNEAIMAANQGANGQAEQQQEWDGEHLQEAEKTLKEMYIQVWNLPSCSEQLLMRCSCDNSAPQSQTSSHP